MKDTLTVQGEEEILTTCRELDIAFVPYSPLGRGFLTGQYKSIDDFASNDFRRLAPRFQGDNFQKNLKLVDHISVLTAQKGCTTAQLALAWVLAQGDDLLSIPGTKRIKYLEENAAAIDVILTADELAQIDALMPQGVAAGERLPVATLDRIRAQY